MTKPQKYKRKFRVTVTSDATFVVWADSADQVKRAFEAVDQDDLFDLMDSAFDIHVEDCPDMTFKKVESGIVAPNDDDPPEWVNNADLPWIPVEKPELDDDYTPTPTDLEAAGQVRMEEL